MLDQTAQKEALSLAKTAILSRFQPLTRHKITPHSPQLLKPGAAFVTLNRQHRLRGCIGSLQAYRPLYEDIWHNAQAAAFADPRFPPLNQAEISMGDTIEVEISVLSPPQPLANCHSYEDLLAQLRPGIDGLILTDASHKATFLPSVWEQLPDKATFIAHLLQKAGIPHWHSGIRCEVYQSQAFSKNWAQIPQLDA